MELSVSLTEVTHYSNVISVFIGANTWQTNRYHLNNRLPMNESPGTLMRVKQLGDSDISTQRNHLSSNNSIECKCYYQPY